MKRNCMLIKSLIIRFFSCGFLPPVLNFTCCGCVVFCRLKFDLVLETFVFLHHSLTKHSIVNLNVKKYWCLGINVLNSFSCSSKPVNNLVSNHKKIQTGNCKALWRTSFPRSTTHVFFRFSNTFWCAFCFITER